MIEGENRNAVAMAISIGSKPSEPEKDWLSLSKIDFSNVLEALGAKIGFDQSEWQAITSQAGVWMLNNLDEQVADLQNKAVEQSTAIELRRIFGVPLSLLAMPVFVELEKMEINAKMALKEQAIETAQIWEQINERLLYIIQLFLAEQIQLVEEESLAHQAALDASKQEAAGMPVLAKTMQDVERQFQEKMEQLKERKIFLTNTFSKVDENLKSSSERVFATTIFSAKNQNLTANAIT
jgi:hypothetical protein